MASVIEMTNFYDAGGILVPKTREHDQFLDPKCIGPDLYGEMACAKFRDFFHRVLVVCLIPGLLTLTRTLP